MRIFKFVTRLCLYFTFAKARSLTKRINESEKKKKEHTHKRNVKVNVGKCSNLTYIKLKKQIIFLKSQV